MNLLINGSSIPTGYKPDTIDRRDYLFGDSKIAVSRPLLDEDDFDYREFDDPKVQIASSCIGHSIAASAYLCLVIAGIATAFPSPLFPYTVGRLLERAPVKPGADRLVDRGSYFRLGMEGLREYGLVAESDWPELSVNINRVPPLDTFQEGEYATLESYYRIPDGKTASDEILAALQRGYCPIFGMMVDSKYANIGKGLYDSPGGGESSGHAQVIIGHSSTLNAFLVRNTWGRSFGDEGYAWVSRRYMNLYSYDKWVISAAPRLEA